MLIITILAVLALKLYLGYVRVKTNTIKIIDVQINNSNIEKGTK